MAANQFADAEVSKAPLLEVFKAVQSPVQSCARAGGAAESRDVRKTLSGQSYESCRVRGESLGQVSGIAVFLGLILHNPDL